MPEGERPPVPTGVAHKEPVSQPDNGNSASTHFDPGIRSSDTTEQTPKPQGKGVIAGFVDSIRHLLGPRGTTPLERRPGFEYPAEVRRQRSAEPPSNVDIRPSDHKPYDWGDANRGDHDLQEVAPSPMPNEEKQAS